MTNGLMWKQKKTVYNSMCVHVLCLFFYSFRFARNERDNDQSKVVRVVYKIDTNWARWWICIILLILQMQMNAK